MLTIPVFLTYHLGIVSLDRLNGADLVSPLIFRLLEYSLSAYIALTVGLALGIALVAWWLRRRGRARPAEWLPVLAESTCLAVVMLFAVAWTTGRLVRWQIAAGGEPLVNESVANQAFANIVLACGAGFHEELLFRFGLFGGLRAMLKWVIWLPYWPTLIAIALSSVLFSAVHYIGPYGDALELPSFVFRALCGVYLALVYRYRGFAVAVYTHTIYDLIVMFRG